LEVRITSELVIPGVVKNCLLNEKSVSTGYDSQQQQKQKQTANNDNRFTVPVHFVPWMTRHTEYHWQWNCQAACSATDCFLTADAHIVANYWKVRYGISVV